MIKRGMTQELGHRTQKVAKFSPLMVTGKDPEFDYAFRRKSDLEQNGGIDFQGFQIVSEVNNNGERWDGPKSLQSIYSARGSISYVDTVLCKRPKEVSVFFKKLENEKYNAQVRFIQSSANRTQMKLRQLDPGASVLDNSHGLDSKVFMQRVGPNEESDLEKESSPKRGRPKK